MTRLYFHAAASGVSGTLPTSEQSSLTSAANADAQTVNRSMDTTIGTSQAYLNILATSSTRDLYYTKFVSPVLYQTSVAANTWTYAFGAETAAQAFNFPVPGTDGPVYVNCYVWRPSTGAKVGTILDGNTASTVDKGATNTEIYHIVTFSGSAVSSMQNGDVIVLEIWFRITSTSTGGDQRFYYDGTTVYAENDTSTSAASYLETPETLNFTAGNQVVRTLTTETINVAPSTPTWIKAIRVNKSLTTETVNVAPSTPTRLAAKIRKPATETVSITEHLSMNEKHLIYDMPAETLNIQEGLTCSIPRSKFVRSPSYWQPLRPRIRIYARTDTTYSTPLYTYDAFSDAGTTGKPVSLTFDSTTGNAGTFALEIEDSGNSLDPDLFSRGNRVFIDCSKDGSTYQAAFKGLVRSIDLKAYGQSGKNLIIKGYSYLVRLSERIVDLKAQSDLDGNGFYIRNDADMLTNTILNTLLTNDAGYLYTQDDTALYSFFKVNNISSSNIKTWVPRFDAQLAQLNTAVESILEFSNSLLGINMSTDELMLYNQDDVTSDSQVFLLTNKIDDFSDRADTTMYPLEPYTYDFGYDYPDSGNRLIASIGTSICPEVLSPPPPPPPTFYYVYTLAMGQTMSVNLTTPCPGHDASGAVHGYMTYFRSAIDGTYSGIQLPVASIGNLSSSHNSVKARIYAYASGTSLGSQLGSDITLYKDGVSGTAFPSASNSYWILKTEDGWTSPTLTASNYYWLGVLDDISNSTNYWALTGDSYLNGTGVCWIYTISYSSPSWWGNGFYNPWGTLPLCYTAGNGYNIGDPLFHIDLITPPPDPTILSPACGGPPNTADAEPNFQIAADINGFNRIAMVEKTLTGLPDHIKTQQTMSEYMFAKLYTSSKPKFTFDFPSVTIPNILPKAGDLVCHVDTLTNTGTANSPMQTGIISQINYNFKEDESGVIGLRKLALSTSGIKRGTY